eukprot:1909434-Rhodomonas_salina.1
MFWTVSGMTDPNAVSSERGGHACVPEHDTVRGEPCWARGALTSVIAKDRGAMASRLALRRSRTMRYPPSMLHVPVSSKTSALLVEFASTGNTIEAGDNDPYRPAIVIAVLLSPDRLTLNWRVKRRVLFAEAQELA